MTSKSHMLKLSRVLPYESDSHQMWGLRMDKYKIQYNILENITKGISVYNFNTYVQLDK